MGVQAVHRCNGEQVRKQKLEVVSEDSWGADRGTKLPPWVSAGASWCELVQTRNCQEISAPRTPLKRNSFGGSKLDKTTAAPSRLLSIKR